MNFPIKPVQASEQAVSYDNIFNATLGLSVFFAIVVFLMVMIFAIRYRRGTKVDRTNPLTHHNGLEMIWLFGPLFLGLGFFVWSSVLYVQRRNPPKDALELFVIGKQWMWHVQHMNGVRENNEMHIPVGRPIKLTMISQDVIHAMYLPEFRTQYHVVPGRYTQLWFTPTKTGRFKMLCGMHCGTQHSEMVGFVNVLTPQEYTQWLENGGNRFEPIALNMVEAGRQLFASKRCGNCHGDRDTPRGPALSKVFGSTVTFEDGSSTKADEEYIRESIVNPYQRITKGYQNTMPSYQGGLSEDQILKLVTYIRSLSTGDATATSDRPVTKPAPTAPDSAVDIANDVVSAGATQSKTTEAN